MPAAMTQRGLKHQSLLELIASCPPSRPRNGTTSCTVTASLTRGLRVLPHQTVIILSRRHGENEFDFAGLVVLEGKKFDNIKPLKFMSSSRLLPLAEGFR